MLTNQRDCLGGDAGTERKYLGATWRRVPHLYVDAEQYAPQLCGWGLGVEGACVDLAIKYANERIQFGRPVSKFQLVQGQLADMVAEHQAAQLLVYNAAYLKD